MAYHDSGMQAGAVRNREDSFELTGRAVKDAEAFHARLPSDAILGSLAHCRGGHNVSGLLRTLRWPLL